MSTQRQAWLYCAIDADFVMLGEIEDEGSFERLINDHCEAFTEDHRHCTHVLIEGSPEYAQVADLIPELHGDVIVEAVQREARRRLGLPEPTR